MIKVTIKTNVDRKVVVIDPNTTIAAVLEENEFDFSMGGFHLNGAALLPSDYGKTFSDFGITEQCFLVKVAKLDNA